MLGEWEDKTKLNTIVEYRTIQGCSGYRIGSDGSVWSCLTKNRDSKNSPTKLGKEWKYIKPTQTKKGYFAVVIRQDQKDGQRKRKNAFVHVLMLEAFVGPRPERMQCRHLDGNPTNNSLDNLTWGTQEENWEDRRKHGTARHSEATKQLISEKLKGKSKPPGFGEKISIANKGKSLGPMTEETKAKIRKFWKGKTYDEIYGSRAEEEREKRRRSNG